MQCNSLDCCTAAAPPSEPRGPAPDDETPFGAESPGVDRPVDPRPSAVEAAPGKSVEVTWLAEEGEPTETVRLLKCEPPKRLALATGPDKDQPWLVTVELFEVEDGTRLEFRQQMSNGLSPSLVGTGWEFYLDRYVAALDGAESAPFEDYHVLQPHYEELQAAMALCDHD